MFRRQAVCLASLGAGIVFCAGGSTAPRTLAPEAMAAWAQSDAIAIATVLKIGSCPSAHSGMARVYQRLELQLDETILGEFPDGLVSACRKVDSGCLENTNYSDGSRAIVFSRRRESLPIGCDVEIVKLYPSTASLCGLFREVADECFSQDSFTNVHPQPNGNVELVRERLRSHHTGSRRQVVDLRVGVHGNILDPEFFTPFLGHEYSIKEVAESPARDRLVVAGTNGRYGVVFVAQLGSRCPPRELNNPARFGVESGESVWSAGWPHSFVWVSDTELAFLDRYPGDESPSYIYVYNVVSSARRAIKTDSPLETLELEGDHVLAATSTGTRLTLSLESLVVPGADVPRTQ